MNQGCAFVYMCMYIVRYVSSKKGFVLLYARPPPNKSMVIANSLTDQEETARGKKARVVSPQNVIMTCPSNNAGT